MQVRNTLRKLALGALLVGASGTLSACIITDPGSSGGGYHDADDGYGSYPPAHPRHGYRYGYAGGISLIFDSGLGLYSVYGYPDYYYNDGYFYRWNSGYWNRSRRWNNRWERCDERYWPRPIHNVYNNYYGQGRRPHHDWDRDGQHDGHGERGEHGRGEHDGRGDPRDQPGDHHGGQGGSPSPGAGGNPGGRPPAGRGGQDNGDDHGNVPGDRDGRDEHRERGDRYTRPPEHRDDRGRSGDFSRDLNDELRARAHERDPVDHQRQMDDTAQRAEEQRAQHEAAAREQGARQEAERGMREQQHDRERGERAAAEQGAHEQRREAERAQREQRSEEQRAQHEAAAREQGAQQEAERGMREQQDRERGERAAVEQRARDAESREHDNRGGERGDDPEDVRGDRR